MYTNTIKTDIPTFIDQTFNQLSLIPALEWEHQPNPDRWSRKEIAGHLIDSAMNNIRRLLVTPYQANDRIVYRQEDWVRASDYQHTPVPDILALWKLLNLQFHRIAQNIPVTSMDLTCDTGQDQPSLHTLAFLIDDYWGHQQHHLRQILGE